MALQTFPAARQGKLLLIGALGLGLAACASNERPQADLAAAQVTAIGVNSYLWRATLETLSFMPLNQADSAGGVIVTDWYANPENPNERVKLSVSILTISMPNPECFVSGRASSAKNGCCRWPRASWNGWKAMVASGIGCSGAGRKHSS